MSPRTSGRIVGALFLSAFVFYGGGSALGPVPGGIALIFLNSIAVIGIGLLVRARLATDAPRIAEVYLWGRAAEAVLLAAGVWFLLAERQNGVDLMYAAAMVALAAASVPLFPALARLGWIPRWFSLWAVLGYLLLAAGAVLEFAAPGVGLFLRAGFPARSASDAASVSAPESASAQP
jgi:hypothetical protein